MNSTAAQASIPPLDTASQGWLDALRGSGSEHERAVQSLNELLLRAARFEVGRRTTGSTWPAAEREDLAQQSADDALVAVLAKLDEYRGASRFTTWAYKFALFEAAAKTRRRAWHDREIVLDSENWRLIGDSSVAPDREVEMSELLGAVRDGIEEVLTRHQREILVAVTLDDVPIDVLAERLNTTRGALYKTLHDARRKLRRRLIADGFGGDLPGQGIDHEPTPAMDVERSSAGRTR
jgi:RNA polymerase sigma-70 factor (ECF subfamily)